MSSRAMSVTVAQIDLFRERLPRRPYHARIKPSECGVHIASLQQAIKSRYIQPNGPTHRYWLLFDLDRPGSGLAWDDRGCPPPNIAVMNPGNRKCHYLYGLDVPVRTAADGRSDPLRYAAAIEHALAVKLGADLGYAGLICKNPLHEHWDVVVWEDTSYDLGTLSDWLDLSAYSDRRKRMPDYGLGRNCTLFETLRQWAYKAIRQGWPDYNQWLEACLTRATGINSRFDQPLPRNEVRHTAKSVARWTHRNFSAASWEAYVAKTHTPEVQAARGRRKGKSKRDELMPKVLEMRERGLNQTDIAEACGVSQRTVSSWLKRF